MTNEEFIEAIRLEGEEWRETPGMEGFYAASTEGRIISLGRYVRRGNGSLAYNPPKLKAQSRNSKGYFIVDAWIKGERKRTFVSYMIAKTFIPNPGNKPCIDHIDRDPTNNRVSNLRWCTQSENLLNPLTIQYRNGRSGYRIHHIPVVSLNEGVIFKRYESIAEASMDGYNRDKIRIVCEGKRNLHGNLQWMYLEDYEKSISSSSSPE